MAHLHLAGFLIAGPVVHSHAVWRHPRTERPFTDPLVYLEAARAMEAGLFDLLFFADRLGVSDGFGGSRDGAFRWGAQDAARLDPLPIVSFLAGHVRRIGLGLTRSTSFDQPTHVARSFATLDHLTGGRAAWNVVTSMNDSEARMFGHARHGEHDTRYDRADEFLAIAHALWRSWAPDALRLDRAAGILADPARIRPVRHDGPAYAVDGPLNVPPGPAGRPVILQAGASGRGRRFGGRWADAIFAIARTIGEAQRFRRAIHDAAREAGRDPASVKVLNAVMPFIGRTAAEAEATRAEHDALARPELGLLTMSSQMNVDFSAWPLSTTIAALVADPALPAPAREKLGSFEPGASLEAVGREWAASVRVPQLVGTADTIADTLAAWFAAGACDGFVISPWTMPGAFTDFTEAVVPILQARGLFRTEYATGTLAARFGVPDA